MTEQGLEDWDSLPVALGREKLIDAQIRQHIRVLDGSKSFWFAMGKVTRYCLEARFGFASQLCAEGPCSIRIGEARAGADHLESVLRDPEARSETSKEQSNLGPARSAVEMSFIDDQEKAFVGELGEPLARCVKDRTLEGPHEHVLEHRVVRDDHVRRCREDLMASK
jgi:hypothetical protein